MASREAGQLREGLLEVVGDALAEESPGHLVSCVGQIADADGVGFDAGLDDRKELGRRFRPAVDAEEPVEPARPGCEVGEPFGRDNVPGMQGHASRRATR